MYLEQVLSTDGLSHLPSDIRASEKAEIDYIFSLGQMTNTDVRKWSVESFMKDGRMLKDRGEINKVFFTEKGDLIDFNFDKDTEDWIRAKSRSFSTDTPEQIKSKITSYVNSIHNYSNDINGYLDSIGLWKHKLELLEKGSDLSFMKSMEKMSRSPYWQFHKITENSIFFKSTNDIVIHHVESDKGVDITHNFGKCVISIKPTTKRFYVHALDDDENTSKINSYFHPHVNHTGDVCWGTASNSVSAFIQMGALEKIAPLLWSLLATYNPDSPYVKLISFVEVKKNRKIMENAEEYFKEHPIKPLEDQGLDFPANYGYEQSTTDGHFATYLCRDIKRFFKNPYEDCGGLIKTIDQFFSADKFLTDAHWDIENSRAGEGHPQYEADSDEEAVCTSCEYTREDCDCDNGFQYD